MSGRQAMAGTSTIAVLVGVALVAGGVVGPGAWANGGSRDRAQASGGRSSGVWAGRVDVVPDTGAVRYVVAGEGNEARYRVREQLARVSFPSDAVGVTSAVEGELTIGADGEIDRGASRFVIDLAGLKSDSDRRDNYVRRRTLETETHPSAVFVPRAFEGLTLPAAGELDFRLVGDLTIRGVTRPVTWDVTATAAGDAITGQAATRFTFEDFELAKPSVASVLSVADEIRLEYEFRLVPVVGAADRGGE